MTPSFFPSRWKRHQQAPCRDDHEVADVAIDAPLRSTAQDRRYVLQALSAMRQYPRTRCASIAAWGRVRAFSSSPPQSSLTARSCVHTYHRDLFGFIASSHSRHAGRNMDWYSHIAPSLHPRPDPQTSSSSNDATSPRERAARRSPVRNATCDARSIPV